MAVFDKNSNTAELLSRVNDIRPFATVYIKEETTEIDCEPPVEENTNQHGENQSVDSEFTKSKCEPCRTDWLDGDSFTDKVDVAENTLRIKSESEVKQEPEELLHEEIQIKVENEGESENEGGACTLNVLGTASNMPRTGPLFVCDHCDFKTMDSRNFQQHQKQHVGEKQRFACDQCCYTAVYQRDVKRHQTVKHSAKKLLACNLCGYTTSHSTYLKRHQLLHSGEKMFSCDQCQYKSASSAYLKLHQKKHSAEKSFACDQCSYRTAYWIVLNQHQATHSNPRIISEIKTPL